MSNERASRIRIGTRNRVSQGRRRGTPARCVVEAVEPRLLLAATPVISELMAANSTTLLDSFGEASDWLEVCNPDPTQSLDLTGWKLQYKSTVWAFPAMSLGPNAYRVIFADSRDLRDPAAELHTNFNLSKSGADLSLLNPSGQVVQSYAPYPAMESDISYGVGQEMTQVTLVAPGATARYYAPTSSALGSNWTQPGFDDSAWAQGATGLGYVDLVPGLAVTLYKASLASIANLSQAQSVIDTPANQSWSRSATEPYVNYLNTGGSGHFVNDRTFPGLTIGVDADQFVTQAIGIVHIPAAGAWTFGVNSDDGFGLTVGGQSMAFEGLRGASDTLATFTFASAGDYSLTLVGFENAGGGSLEMFAAQGTRTQFDANFRLVGDTANGGLSVMSNAVTGSSGNGSLFAGAVRTDVKAAMTQANNASLYTRIAFDAPDAGTLQTLMLRMAYDDGYVAYLNGVEVARRNAPGAVTWDSTALSARTSDLEVTTFENVDLTPYLNLLQATGNVLAVQVMNVSATDGDLLMLPEVSEVMITADGLHIFSQPTPGLPNTPDTWQPDLAFSVEHGFFDTPVPVAITTTSQGAQIYYTLDSSTPSAGNGTLYTGPITLTKTSTLRAVSVVPGGQAGIAQTETYIFLEDAIGQPANPEGQPSTWGGTAADYAMDTRITEDPAYRNALKESLLSLPTMSLVTDQANLFDAATGIYANPNNTDWERPVSFEYFDPETGEGFQINAALRLYGGYGRNPEFKKHSLRLIFKQPYGPSKLDFPLFGDGAVNVLDTLVLRSNFNDGWTWGGNQAQLIRDAFADRTLLAMGEPAGHGDFVHLYINGMYWGLYNPVERPDTAFAASYLGGEKEEWDAVNAGQSINSTSTQFYDQLMGFDYENGSMAAFQRVQGNNPDGTPNPDYPDLLDMNNYIDYLLMNFYIGNTDWPGHNFYAARPQGPDSTGFKSFPWDSEMATGLQWAYDPFIDVTGASGGLGVPYQGLKNNPEFQMMFADHVQRFLFNGGALTTALSKARYQALADEVQLAIIAESARWGDVSGTLFRPSDWANERDRVLNSWLGQRTSTVVQQLRAKGLYPSIDAPSYGVDGTTEYGGTFLPGQLATISTPGGVIYYTTDGSDPRLPGGGISPDALLYSGGITLAAGLELKSRAYDNGTWSALSDATFYIDLAPSVRITEIMYNPADPTPAEIALGYLNNDDFEFIEVQNTGSQALPLEGLRFTDAVTFTFGTLTLAPGQYALVVSNIDAFEARYPQVDPALIAGTFTGHLDNSGEMVQLDAPNGGLVHQFTYKDGWYDESDGGGFSLTVRDPLQNRALWDSSDGWRNSAAPGGTPGGSDTLAAPGMVVFNEVLANPASGQDAMIELHNASNGPVDVGGWFVSDSSTDRTKYEIAAGTTIAAGGYLVLTQAGNFGNAGDAGSQTVFLLSGRGGDLYLSSNAAGVAGGYRTHVDFGASPAGISFGRVSKSTGSTDFTLLQAPTFGPALSGEENSIAYSSPLVFNEIMYHPGEVTAEEAAAGFTSSSQFEYLELYNRSTEPVALGDHFLGDGVGFSFGWVTDGAGIEVQTLEAGATATWTSAALVAGTYTVLAHFKLVDAEGKRRDDLDDLAQYAITYSGGTANVIVDQNQVDVAGDDVWVNLGSWAFDGPATVQLARGTTAPGNWTVADSVKFIRAGQADVVVAPPVVDSYSMQRGMTTLAPGGYVVLVGDYAAFDARYDVAGSGVPVAGVYSGSLDNNGEWIRLFERGAAEAGYIPAYEVDRVNYEDHAPWADEPDGSGSSLVRAHVAAYGNDPVNWQAGSRPGTPGDANIPIDKSAPTIPGTPTAHTAVNPDRITLYWAASSDAQSSVDHYVIYRDGAEIGTSATAAYTDSDVAPAVRHSYTVSAVNRDGYESTQSHALTVAAAGIVSTTTPDPTHIEILFTEPLNAAVAGVLGRYVFSGGGLTSVTLALNNMKVILTTSAVMVVDQAYTLTMNGMATASGDELSSPLATNFNYAPLGLGTILREYWTGIPDNPISNLTQDPDYPGNPDGRELLTSFEGPTNWAEAYGDRISGYVFPPVTGDYTFWIAGDDACELWLSTDDDPANAVRIAYVVNWAGVRDWEKEANQKSAPVHLEAGRKYYIMSLHKEGGGGDNVAVRWQLPDGSFENNDPTLPIPGNRLSPYGNADLTPPGAPAMVRGDVVGSTQYVLNWDAAVDVESGVSHYLVYRDGSVYGLTATPGFTDASGAGAGTRHTYQVSAVSGGGLEGPRSEAVTLAMAGIASVSCYDPTTVRLTFTEPVTPASAEATGHYLVSGAVVTGAALEADGLSVTLTTTALSLNASHTLTVNGVETLTGEAMPTNLQRTFSYGGSILWEYWLGIAGSAVADLTGNANFPDSPSGREYVTSFETRTDWAETYGSRVRGYLIPAVTGDYNFWIASDDNSELWLSMTEDPAGASLIASVPNWTASRAWTTYAQQKSAKVHLVAGQRYYIEALQKEGGGGDNLAVTWQRAGTAFDGLPIAGQYLAPYPVALSQAAPIGVTLNAVGTSDRTPSINGTVDTPGAVVTVSVNGRFYATENNGDGTWSLPDDAIRPELADGTYAVVATVTDGSGRQGFAWLANGIVVDTVSPVAAIAGIGAVQGAPLSQASIVFSEPVSGLRIADVHLSRDDGSDLITGNETLETTDGITWTLGGLDAVTRASGQYVLRVSALGSQVVDEGNNPLAGEATAAWLNNAVTGTAGGDVIRLRRSGDRIEVTGAGPSYSTPLADFASVPLVVNGLAGDDRLVIDFSGGNPVPGGGLAVDGGAATAGDRIELRGVASGAALVVNAGQVIVGGAAVSVSGVESTMLGGSGSVMALGSLAVGPGARLAVEAGARTLKTGGLTIGAGASLDLADNDLVLLNADASAPGMLRQLLANGRTGMTPSIFSSVAEVSGHATAIGMADNMMLHLNEWNGEAIATGGDYHQVILKQTYRGDTNLDGQVTQADTANVIANMSSAGSWLTGDLNLDGMVTVDDLAEVTANLGAGTAAGGTPLALAAAAVSSNETGATVEQEQTSSERAQAEARASASARARARARAKAIRAKRLARVRMLRTRLAALARKMLAR